MKRRKCDVRLCEGGDLVRPIIAGMSDVSGCYQPFRSEWPILDVLTLDDLTKTGLLIHAESKKAGNVR